MTEGTCAMGTMVTWFVAMDYADVEVEQTVCVEGFGTVRFGTGLSLDVWRDLNWRHCWFGVVGVMMIVSGEKGGGS